MNKLQKLEKELGVQFQNKAILIEALTHSSFANENGVLCNERLEFLGDAVLELSMSKFLFEQYSFNEGEMTKKRAQGVCEDALCIYASHLGLTEYILLGNGEESSGGRNRKAIIADAFEAVLGAVFEEFGFEIAYQVFSKLVLPYIDEILVIKDYKSRFQELVQADKRTISYSITNETGPSHNKKFEAVVYMDSIVMGRGCGKSKKEAEQQAALEALKKMAKE